MRGVVQGTRKDRLLSIAGAVLTAVLVFGATPAVLLILVGDPLGHGLGHAWAQWARITMASLTGVAWVAWAACGVQLARGVITHIRRGHVGLPAGAAGPHGHVSIPTVVAPLALRVAGDRQVPVAWTSAYTVRAGDSLWRIAERALGDGADWTAIAALNLGHTMNDGRRFIDPSVIYAGWILVIPAGSSTSQANLTTPTTTPLRFPTPSSARPDGVSVGPVQPVVLRAPSTLDASHATRPAHRPAAGGLPELLALGFGAIGCAALARRARRARLLRSAATGRPDSPVALTDLATDTGTLLARFTGLPALTAFERANCLLAGAVHRSSTPEDLPVVRAVCVGTAGVDFWLDRAAAVAPEGFSSAAGGKVWHVDHAALASPTTSEPFLPVILPVGDDADGTWLVPVHPGGCLPLLGPAADALWRAARPVQEAWDWAEAVLVSDDAAVVAAHLQPWAPKVAGTRRAVPPVLFFGDPSRLPPDISEVVSMVTTSSVRASDVTVLVDEQAASIHPLGHTVRPHLVSPETADAVDEVMEVSGPPVEVTRATGDASPALPTERGVVEIRLLTMTPRMDGLREELPPNRARRAVELVAYLALHRPDEVTSDRLRTRVLGSSDADAASKTLFNTAAAARKALGSDQAGRPLFPPGTRTGHYRVSPSVTVDVQRAAGLAALGSSTEDPELAMAYLREALTLVEGEPLANALSGYTWWEAEGHGARAAAVLVNAACDLAALAVEAGLFDLAMWGLGQARMLDPYSEALSRVAMQVAAAAGDADRLRLEWRECQRRVDELDPGSTPSPRTERLYGELAQRVLVGAHAAAAL